MRFRRVPLVAPRPPSFRASVNSGLALAKAGTNPKRIPVTIATTAVTNSTTMSTFASARRGTVRAPILASRSSAQIDKTTPTTAPPIASNTLSVSICRSNRHGPAPSATRMASSRSRALARASNMVARFAHAIRSTPATEPNKIIRPFRIPPTT